jgi:hypothetical protein
LKLRGIAIVDYDPTQRRPPLDIPAKRRKIALPGPVNIELLAAKYVDRDRILVFLPQEVQSDE